MIHLERTAQVWAITGNLGGGKSLSAVCMAVCALNSGYFVCSNITLDIAAIASAFGKSAASRYMHIDLDSPTFDPFQLPCGSPRGSGGNKRVLVILDECAEWVDQYTSAKDPRISRLWSWIRHSSKRSQDVILVVQRVEYLNKVLRLLIARWVIVDDMAVWRMPVIRLRIPFTSNLVMQRVFDRSGRLLYSPTYISKSFWGNFYNTAECLNSDGATYTMEYELDSTPLVFPVRSMFLYFASILVLFWYAGCSAATMPAAGRARADGGGLAFSYTASYPHTGDLV